MVDRTECEPSSSHDGGFVQAHLERDFSTNDQLLDHKMLGETMPVWERCAITLACPLHVILKTHVLYVTYVKHCMVGFPNFS